MGRPHNSGNKFVILTIIVLGIFFVIFQFFLFPPLSLGYVGILFFFFADIIFLHIITITYFLFRFSTFVVVAFLII
jgi:hypothetical protein